MEEPAASSNPLRSNRLQASSLLSPNRCQWLRSRPRRRSLHSAAAWLLQRTRPSGSFVRAAWRPPRRRRRVALPFVLIGIPLLLALLVGALTLERPAPEHRGAVRHHDAAGDAAADVFPEPTSLPPVETTPEPTPDARAPRSDRRPRRHRRWLPRRRPQRCHRHRHLRRSARDRHRRCARSTS